MKKNLLIVSLLILITPSVVFASWWNPFSWSIFHRADTKTQVLEKQIKELESKLNLATTTASTSKEVKEIVSEKKVEVRIKEVIPAENLPKEVPIQNVDERINPAGGWYTPAEFVKNGNTKCASQNKVLSHNINSDGSTNCITYTQACQDEFGANGIYSGKKDSEGLLICGCKDGYVVGADKKSCQIQQKNSCAEGNPYGFFNDGVVYSPDQKNQIMCSYCGGTWCNNSASVQINNYYQYKPSGTPIQTVNCANYQIEKNRLDQTASNQGSLFSGARVSSENALKAKYPGCY